MRNHLRILFPLLLLTLFVSQVHAAKRYWVGGTSNSYKLKANWSTVSGGAGGATIPGSSDTAFFDGAAVRHRCNMDSLMNVKRLDMSGDTLSQGANTITIGSTGASLSGGVFLGGSSNITVSGAFTISGNVFTSTSGTFSTSANLTISSGSFTDNSGTVTMTATSTLTISRTGGVTFYTLSFAPSVNNSTFTITSTTALTVSHLLSIAGSKGATLNSGTLNVTGDITNSSTAISLGGGTATITINGTGKQTFTGTSNFDRGRLPNIVINKSSDTLWLANKILVVGNWTYTAGVVTAGTTSEVTFGNSIITGNHSLYNVTFLGSNTETIATGTTLTVNGTLTLGTGGANPPLNNGTINAKGNIDMSGSTSLTNGGGTATIVINGTGNQSLLGSTGTPFAARICNVNINKPSGTLSIYNNVTAIKNWTWTAGAIDPTTSLVIFNGNITITGSHTLYDAYFWGAGTTYTLASGTTLTTTDNLMFYGTSSLTLTGGTLEAEGDISDYNVSTSTTGTTAILIDGSANQTYIGSGTAGAGKLPNVTINKSGGTLTLSGVISVTGDWIYTAGTVASSGSKVCLYGRNNLNGTGGGATMPFYDLTIAGSKRSLTGNINVTHNLTINASDSLAPSTYTINVGNDWVNNGVWSFATSTVEFNGTSYGAITKASGTETFYNLKFNRDTCSQRLLCPVTVNNVLTLTKGHVKTTSTNYLTLIDNATVSGGSDSAYVHGPMRKTGDDVFTFPLGDTTLNDTAYHPLGMTTAPSSTGDQFEATYFAHNQTSGSTLVDSLMSLSDCEYWTLERKAGSSTVKVSVGWNSNSCNVTSYDDLRLTEWNGTQWRDLGASGITVSDRMGTVTAAGNLAFTYSLAPITIAKPTYTQPYAILRKKLDAGYTTVVNGHLMFKYDEEYYDADNKLTFNIYNDLGAVVASNSLTASYLLENVYYGDNRYLLNILDCGISPNGNLTSGFYILEVINEKNEHWYLRFKHIVTITPNCSNTGGGGL